MPELQGQAQGGPLDRTVPFPLHTASVHRVASSTHTTPFLLFTHSPVISSNNYTFVSLLTTHFFVFSLGLTQRTQEAHTN